ncbi:facilitated trehalose transporter Tret1-2 homolog [Linepithema humile]|uniref:facilitated trehalose transporter Tret1-2 homolog n=1 Tax=Linepithema humile TaxID=83485 RepID=UPI00062390B6|nr:PREDICTED: facilitated trehalose transporter Tret1-2 homolog [Linepithema humile]XP_012220614.1 PREDICTED: facilitated trehalose transporter Tret1-2 homolog [Linepithema humile]
MDPYSLSVEREASKNIEENERTRFKEAIVSSRSLNRVQPNQIKNALREISVCIIAASFHLVVGITMAYSATLVPQLENPEESFHATKQQTSWIASLVVISAPIGAMLGGFLMESVGRIRTLQIGVIPNVIGWIMIATAQNIPMLLVGRLLCGMATAMEISPAIVYITEVARPELRGSLISVGPTLASLGMVLSYVKGSYLHWRLVAWLSIIYAIVPVILVQFLVPESPVWLVSKNRIADAQKALERIHKNEPCQDKGSAAEVHFNTIMDDNAHKLTNQRKSKHGNVFTKIRAFLRPTGWKPMVILFLLFSFQQFSGIYITLFYAVTWFQETGAGVDAYVASILVGIMRFICSMMNTWLLRRFCRRPLCMISAVGMAVCMGISGYASLRIKQGDHSGSWVPLVCLLLYVFTSMIGMLTIPWTMTAELFPTEIRGFAHAISYSIANLLMFAALQSYRDLQTFLGGSYAVQWFFACVSLATTAFVWLMLPETHEKKLSEIEAYFENNFFAVGAKVTTNKRRAKPDKCKNQQDPLMIEPLNPPKIVQIA